MTKFNLDKLREVAEPRKERKKMTPEEKEERLKKLHEYFKKKRNELRRLHETSEGVSCKRAGKKRLSNFNPTHANSSFRLDV